MPQPFVFLRGAFISIAVCLLLAQQLGCACMWPSKFAFSTWIDSTKGELLFLNSSMTGWQLTAREFQVDEWECHSSEYFDSNGYLIMRTKTTVVQFGRLFYGYRCLHLSQIMDASYRFYEIGPIQSNAGNERIVFINNTAVSSLTELCPTDYAAIGSEYKLLIKKGDEEMAKVFCPYNIAGRYDYNYTSSSGTITCPAVDNLDMCNNNKELRFSYDTCSTLVAYSTNNTVWCVDVVPVSSNVYVTVYNGLDTSDTIDDITTYRFTCFAFSADVTRASVTPQHCKKDQSPDSVPVDNSGTSTGATLTMATISDPCPPCPVLEVPTEGKVTIVTNGAITTATYECLNNYTPREVTRTCQDDGTWSGNEPTCTPTSGDSTVPTAAIVGGVLGSLALIALVVIVVIACKTLKLCNCLSNKQESKKKSSVVSVKLLSCCLRQERERSNIHRKDEERDDLTNKRLPRFINEQPAVPPKMTALNDDSSNIIYKTPFKATVSKPSFAATLGKDSPPLKNVVFKGKTKKLHKSALTPVEMPSATGKTSRASVSTEHSVDKLRSLSSVNLSMRRDDDRSPYLKSRNSGSASKASARSIELLDETLNSESIGRVSSLSKYLNSTQESLNFESTVDDETVSSSIQIGQELMNTQTTLGLKPILPISASESFVFGSKMVGNDATQNSSTKQYASTFPKHSKENSNDSSANKRTAKSLTPTHLPLYSKKSSKQKRRLKTVSRNSSKSSRQHQTSANTTSSQWTTVDEETLTNRSILSGSRGSSKQTFKRSRALRSSESTTDRITETSTSSQWTTVDERTLTGSLNDSVSVSSKKPTYKRYKRTSRQSNNSGKNSSSQTTQSSQWSTVEEKTTTNSTVASTPSNIGPTNRPPHHHSSTTKVIDKKLAGSTQTTPTSSVASAVNKPTKGILKKKTADGKSTAQITQATKAASAQVQATQTDISSLEVFFKAHGYPEQVYPKSVKTGIYYISDNHLATIDETSEHKSTKKASKGKQDSQECTNDLKLYSENTFSSQWETIDEETVTNSDSTDELDSDLEEYTPVKYKQSILVKPIGAADSSIPFQSVRLYNGYEPDSD